MRGWEVKGRVDIAIQRIRNMIAELDQCHIIGQVQNMRADVYASGDRLPLERSIDLPRKPIKEGQRWGNAWDSGYFRLVFSVPAEWESLPLCARLELGGESLVYDRSGSALYGLTNHSQYDLSFRKELLRLGTFPSGHEIELFVETAANGLFGVDRPPVVTDRSNPSRHGVWDARLNSIQIGIYNEQAWQLHLDLVFLMHLYEYLDRTSVRAVRILGALFEASIAFSSGDFSRARECLAPELAKGAHASSLATTVIGHAHIDTAWLWPLAETRRKVVRTFASQIDLIGTYPSFVFGASAPQHYAWVKQDQPALYEKVKHAIAAGRWEVQGGMWVEPDCNLVSGESLVRQILHGKRFFKTEFGKDVRTCWIPDVFGYPGSMPQILAKSGLSWFLTQKMSWSKHTMFPYDTFVWRGIDGSSVVTHFLPEHTYNSAGLPGDLARAEQAFHEKDRLDEFVTLLGIGDGGGGPKEDHVEMALRAADCESVPRASFGNAEDFFRRMEQKRHLLETYDGELYLEYHRGTYTTQARTKRDNRRIEEELGRLEALYCCLDPDAWPSMELDGLAKTLLLLQFHDILPGSSIHQVYEDVHVMHARMLEQIENLQVRALEKLVATDESRLTVFNTLAIDCRLMVDLPMLEMGDGLRDTDGSTIPVQRIVGSNGSVRHVSLVRVASQGWRTLEIVKNGQVGTEAEVSDPLVLENAEVLYRFDTNGNLVQAVDKETNLSLIHQNAIPAETGPVGNRCVLYHDTPHTYEAWDIDYYYTRQTSAILSADSWERIASGPVCSMLRFHYSFGSSSMVQDVVLAPVGRLLEFRSSVEWHETRKLLRVSFPVHPLAENAVCDIPYGQVRRPALVRSESDFAKFEFSARTYVDVYHDGNGIALLNDCKYGYSCRDGELGLSLLRSPLNPDPDADLGHHEFTYALLPHMVPLADSRVTETAALLNRSPLVVRGNGGRGDLPLRIAGTGVSVGALKRAEDGTGMVLRMAEVHGCSRTVRLEGVGTVVQTDLMEQPLCDSTPVMLPCEITLKPYEISTWRTIET